MDAILYPKAGRLEVRQKIITSGSIDSLFLGYTRNRKIRKKIPENTNPRYSRHSFNITDVYAS